MPNQAEINLDSMPCLIFSYLACIRIGVLYNAGMEHQVPDAAGVENGVLHTHVFLTYWLSSGLLRQIIVNDYSLDHHDHEP